jgi:hypothetical protein
MDRALRLYLEQLGFRLVEQTRIEPGGWAAVAPPDGTSLIVLVEPEPSSQEYQMIGGSRHVIFVAEDVASVFEAWSKGRSRFANRRSQPPSPRIP